MSTCESAISTVFVSNSFHNDGSISVGSFVILGGSHAVVLDADFFGNGIGNLDHSVVAGGVDLCTDECVFLQGATLNGIVIGIGEKSADIRGRHFLQAFKAAGIGKHHHYRK